MELSREPHVVQSVHASIVRAAVDVVPALPRLEALAPKASVPPRVPCVSSAASRWEDLIHGRLIIVDHGVREFYASLTVATRPESSVKPCHPDAAAMMRRILTGSAQKIMAHELQVAESTASLRAAATLREFGLDSTTRRVPSALAALAASHAVSSSSSPPGYHEVPNQAGQLELRLPRPEGRLRRYVSRAEYDVLKAVVAGSSYQDVGALLQRSPRTVANQLRSISLKLGVCGRLQYINLAIRLSLNATDESAIPISRAASRGRHGASSERLLSTFTAVDRAEGARELSPRSDHLAASVGDESEPTGGGVGR